MESLDEKDVIAKLGQKIKLLREKQGITQQQLAFESEIPRNQIGRIERGEINTTIKSMTLIANALGIHVKSLLDFD